MAAQSKREQPIANTKPARRTVSPRPRKRPPTRTPEQTQKRLARIIELRSMQELTWPEIALDLGMSEVGCRQAYAAFLRGDREAMLHEDRTEVLQRKLESMRHVRRVLLSAIDSAMQEDKCKECGRPCGHTQRTGVAVSAARSLLMADEREIVARQLVGLLPRDLGELKPVLAARAIGDLFIEVCNRHLKAGSKVTQRMVIELGREFSAAMVGELEGVGSRRELEPGDDG